MASEMTNVVADLEIGQKYEMMLMETLGPLYIFMRILANDANFQAFSHQMVAFFNNQKDAYS